MQIFQLALVVAVDTLRRVANLAEDWAESDKVIFEIAVQLVEVSHTACHCLNQLPIRLDRIFLADILTVTAVQGEELEVRLAIAHLGSLEKHHFGFVEVTRDTEAFHVKDAHPVHANETALLRRHVIVPGRLVLVRIVVGGLRVGELCDRVTSTAALVRRLFDDSLESSHDLLHVRVSIESNAMVGLIF